MQGITLGGVVWNLIYCLTVCVYLKETEKLSSLKEKNYSRQSAQDSDHF